MPGFLLDGTPTGADAANAQTCTGNLYIFNYIQVTNKVCIIFI